MVAFLSSLFTFVRSLLIKIIGEFSWNPPRWLRFLTAILTWPFRFVGKKYWGLKSSAPQKFKKISLSVAGVFVIGIGGLVYYKSLPEPYKVSYTLDLPEPTSLEVTADRPVPIPNPLYVSFSGTTAPISLVGKVVQKGILVNPPVEGEWTWEQDNKLRFQPKSEWPVGNKYEVKFEKGSLKPGVVLSSNKFYFTSPEFIPTMQRGEFYEDPTDPKVKQTVFTVQFTHAINKGELERKAKLLMRVEPIKNFDDAGVKKLPFTVSYNKYGNVAYLRSSIIQIPENDGEVLVKLDSGIHAANGGKPSEKTGEYSVKVPGIENYFKVSSISHSVVTNKETYEAEKILTVESTAGVSDSEIKKGIEAFLLPTDPKYYENIEKKEDIAEASDCGEEGCEGEEEYSEEYRAPSPRSCPLSSVSQVTDELVKNSKKVSLDIVPSEYEGEKVHNFKYSAPDSSCVYVKVKKGTKAVGDFALANNSNFLVESGPYPPDVQFMHEGGLLSITGEKKLSVLARNVKQVKFTLKRVLPNALNHLVSSSYGNFSTPEFSYNFGPDNFSESFESVQTVSSEKPGKPSYLVYDFSNYLSGNVPKGLFILEAKGWDEERKTSLTTATTRLVLVSDIGFLVKSGNNGEAQLFVASLRNQEAIGGAKVQVLGKNGLPIFEGTTDEVGRVALPSLKDFKREKQPSAYVVLKDGDLSFMPYDRSDRQLNFSKFDIGGLYSSSYTDSLQGFVFNDRGIYRPGEEARFGLIVKSNSWSSLAPGTPFQLTISDPRGREIKKENIKLGADGFEEFKFQLSSSAITGYYSLNLSLVKKPNDIRFLGSSSFKVEEFLPDRLKIATLLSSSNPQGWISPEGLKAKVSLLNLFGTPASGNTIKTRLVMTPGSFYFSKFKDYFFYDTLKVRNSVSDDLGESTTDDNGQVEVNLNLDRFEKGTYRVSVAAEGFEKEGGRSVIAGTSEMVSPLPFVVGVKAGSDRSYLKANTPYDVSLIAVSPKGESVESGEVQLELIQKKNVSTLTKLESGSFAYQSVEKKESKSKALLKIAEGGQKLKLPTETPGDYLYEIRDSQTSALLNSFEFGVIGEKNQQQNHDAELEIKLQKADYSPGEEIEFEVRAPYTGVGLITIERDKVYAHKWFKTDTNSSIQKIVLPEGVEGNGYLNVSFIRSLSSPEIFVSPLSYGVKPFSVSRGRRTENLVVDVPQKILPGHDLEISISSGEPTRAVIFAVDEGILQVSKYKKPEPLSFFFQKRALEVNTSQIVDQLLPEFELIRKLSGIGGDSDAMGGRYQNPFKRKGQKPIAYWSGIVATDTEAKKIKFPIPDYFNGNVKVFALSVSNSKIGVTEKSTLVQGDVIITPSAPVVAAPGDQFEIGAVITNLRGGSDKVSVSLDTDESRLKVEGSKKEVTIPIGSEAKVNFTVNAQEKLGEAKFTLYATAVGSPPVSYGLDLSVRPASPELSTIQIGSVKQALLGSVLKTLEVDRNMFSERALRELSVSSLPIGLVRGLQRYLEKYPYGCSEQLTSQTLPAVALSDYHEFGISRSEAEKFIGRSIQMLASRQQENGAFAMWPGNTSTDTWLSLHVARLLIEAKSRGFRIEGLMFEQTLNYLKTVAGRSEVDADSAVERAYAIYLLTRENVVTTSYLDTLKEGLESSESKEWKDGIASLFMAATYSMLKLDDEARAAKKRVKIEKAIISKGPYFNSLIHTGLALGLISRHFPEDAKQIPIEVFENINKSMEERRYSTISSGLLILGLAEYQKALPLPSNLELKVSKSEDSKIFEPLTLKPGLISTLGLGEKDKQLKLEPSQNTPLYYQLTQSGFDKVVPKEISNRLEIFREYLDEHDKPISSVKLGSDVRVKITFRIKEENFDPGQVAIVDLYPSGFEFVSGKQSNQSFYASYIDQREDRTLIFGSIGTSASSYVYTLKATTKGKFVVPPIFMEAMYDQTANALSSAGTLTVE
jgi:uncharacterized protein YfaS (alpha-2-macroglobulin family)